MHSVCCCSLPVWRRSSLKKGTPLTYFGPALDPALLFGDHYRATEEAPRGIRGTLFSSLEDLDFADDLALLSHTQVNGTDLRQADSLTYLGSIITPEGGTKEDIYSRLGKARSAFRSMNNVWRSGQYSTNTKLKLYRSCVISTLLYGSKCWRMTEADLSELCSFHTTCLRRILRIFWPENISNVDLLRRCRQDHYQETMEMDRACAVERAAVNHENCIALDSIWKEEERETKNNLEENSGERDESHAALLGNTDKTGPGQAGVERLCCCPRRPRGVQADDDGSGPGRIWLKNNNTCKGPWVLHQNQVSSKFIKGFWRRRWKCKLSNGRWTTDNAWSHSAPVQ